jgi:primosomal protein N'
MAGDDPRDGHVPGAPYLTTEELRRDVSALREILQARLDGMDRATELLSETVNRTPTQIQTEISHVRELIQEKLSSLGGQAEEKFKSIELQFVERDVRTNQAATASAQALAAALQAAKEAVFEQAQAAAKAADKTELSFTKQIDLLLAQIKALGDTFGDRLAELKERIDRGEGSTSGAAVHRTEQRLNIGMVMAVLMGVLAVTSLILLAFKK